MISGEGKSIIGIVSVPEKSGCFGAFTHYTSQYINVSFDLTFHCSTKSYQEK